MINSILPVISMMIGFYFGYKIGCQVKKDVLPDIKSPRTLVKEHKEKVKEEKEMQEVKEWISEIDNYKGEFGE